MPRPVVFLAAAVLVGLVIFLFALLFNHFKPREAASLWLSPAASSVDAGTVVAASGSGWQAGEDIALCVAAGDGDACTKDTALALDEANDSGDFQINVPAGPALVQGLTYFQARGLRSGREANRFFRILKAPAGQLVVDNSTGLTNPTGEARPAGTELPPVDAAWAGEYFANPDLSGPAALTRSDAQLSFDWGEGSPDPSLPADGFSARWTRRLTMSGASYRFVAQVQGRVRLAVDGVVLIDQWQDAGGVMTYEALKELAAGDHTLQVEYAALQGPAALTLRWEIVTLYPDWRAEYFANPDLTGEPVLVRNDPDPNLNWGDGSPAPGIVPADGFSARWTRTIVFDANTYRFILTPDDGGRLLIDGQQVVDAWQDATGQTHSFDLGLLAGPHVVEVQARDVSGPASIAIGWSPLLSASATVIANLPPTTVSVATVTPAPTVTPPANSTPTFTPTTGATATPTWTLLPGAATLTPTPTPTAGTGTPAAGTSTPPATSTPGPGTPSATPTPTTPAGAATATPTTGPTTAGTPGGIQRIVDMNPIMGYAATRITITSGNWSPGTVIRIALADKGAPFSQAVDLPLPSFTTPVDSSQSFSVSFQFPNDSRWLNQNFVMVYIHNADWSEWGGDQFDVINE